MNSAAERTRSLWWATTSLARHPPLAGGAETDIAVVGAGIAGLSGLLQLPGTHRVRHQGSGRTGDGQRQHVEHRAEIRGDLMPGDLNLLARLLAYRDERAQRCASHLQVSIQDDGWMVCPIAMAGEATRRR